VSAEIIGGALLALASVGGTCFALGKSAGVEQGRREGAAFRVRFSEECLEPIAAVSDD
jgi:hypothetical protein